MNMSLRLYRWLQRATTQLPNIIGNSASNVETTSVKDFSPVPALTAEDSAMVNLLLERVRKTKNNRRTRERAAQNLMHIQDLLGVSWSTLGASESDVKIIQTLA